MYHPTTYGTLVIKAEHKSEFVFIRDTPYLALTGGLWGVWCEKYDENWPRYNDTALYVKYFLSIHP